MYFKGIAKKSYHFVQNHIFNRKIHIKIIENTDIETSSEVEENDKRRMLVKDTDIGKRLIGEIDDLHKLLENYRRL